MKQRESGKEVKQRPTLSHNQPTNGDQNTMAKYEINTKTANVIPDGDRVLIAKTPYDGPDTFKDVAGNDDDAKNHAALVAFLTAAGAETKVSGMAADNSAVLNIAFEKGINHFQAWQYGFDLLVNQAGRKASTYATEVKDHILEFKGQKVDLDSKNPAELVAALNKLSGAVAMGMSLGKDNTAKYNDMIEKSIEAGTIARGTDGAFTAKANGKAPVTAKK